MTPTGTVRSLWSYPVKGLSPQRLDRAPVQAGHGFAGDREWALGRAGGAYRPGVREPIPKHQFHVLVRDERLAGVATRVEDGHLLTVRVREHVVLVADLDDAAGRAKVSAFFGRMLGLPRDELPVVAREPGRRFTDVSVVSDAMMNAVSLINLASVRALEDRVGRPVDPLRFRANVYYDGLPAFGELDLVGTEVTVGGVRFEAVLNTKRCAATEVNPADARRDLPVPRLLVQHFGHSEMGVYLAARTSGVIRPGDPVVHRVAGAA